ncbi:MAG TPA: M14 family metallopeptidase [Catalimonadaceae bacterium]|nr:M14 family metallopeptidase [Catalimonadaceae bacterium]
MKTNRLFSSFLILWTILPAVPLNAQDFLPPARLWKGKSESIAVGPAHAWCTPAEKSGFVQTPSYKETMDWINKLCSQSPLLKTISIGKTLEGRELIMVVVSTEAAKDAATIKASTKPCLLVQAGIHSGEIDGKDAGLMLLRDIAVGSKKSLLDRVNLLFVPILNADGHERSSAFNRPNQRGPANMGWRTNAQNLNLNRDYARLDTREIRAMVDVMNDWDADFYMDIHVTDGVDFQYDITYNYVGKHGHSPAISSWFSKIYSPFVDKGLQAMGHIPGPFLIPTNWTDFTEGVIDYPAGPNFSNVYADLRHLPGLLVETHSLKPYKQRVLGTYVLLEETMKILGKESQALQEAIRTDKARRPSSVVLAMKSPDSKKPTADSILLPGIRSKKEYSEILGSEVVRWTGEEVTKNVPSYVLKEPAISVQTPKGYWVPSYCPDVLERLKIHGIQMTILKEPQSMPLDMYRIREPKFASAPFEGRIQVKGKAILENKEVLMPVGSAWIPSDQPLGELAVLLLEPDCPESFLQWGFFHSIFQKTEYAEAYFMEPLAARMLTETPALRDQLRQKKKEDPAFAKNPDAILEWFYERSPYYDKTYLLYPVGKE